MPPEGVLRNDSREAVQDGLLNLSPFPPSEAGKQLVSEFLRENKTLWSPIFA